MTPLITACSLFLFAGAVPSPTNQNPSARPAPQDPATLEESTRAEIANISTQLAERRDFVKGRPLALKILSPSEYRKALRAQATELHSPQHFSTIGHTYRLFGILPESFDGDLLDLVVENLAASILGLYSATSQCILIPRVFEQVGLNEEQNAAQRLEILAHEIHHARQDQRWDLETLIGRGAASHDRRLAASALMEGDAVATAFDWLLGQQGSSLEEWEGDLGEQVIHGINLANVMNGSQTGAFQNTEMHAYNYGQGATFVDQLLQEGGWTRVESAFENPPASTEQVLHPEKYRSEPDYPVELPITIPQELAADGWTVQASDVLGELQLQLFFARAMDEAIALKASMGWDGDRYLLLEKEGIHALLWVSEWDSSSDARGAGRAISLALGLSQVEAKKGRSALPGRAVGSTHLQVTKDRVVLAVGLPSLFTEQAIEAAAEIEAVLDPRDVTRGRSDAKVTRRLQREALARLEAQSVTLVDASVHLRKLGLSFPLPAPEWALGDWSQLPAVQVMVIRSAPTVNFNVTSAPTQGLTREQTIQSNLETLPKVFGDFELIAQASHEREQGPGFDLRFSGTLNGRVAHIWQRAFLRDDNYVVLTATNIGSPIEGELEAEFRTMLDGAQFDG